MKAWKSQNLREYHKQVPKLIKNGYIVREFGEWHFRISRTGVDTFVDVWASSKKFMQKGAHESGIYDDIHKLLAEIFEGTEAEEKIVTDVQNFRKDPLKFLKEK